MKPRLFTDLRAYFIWVCAPVLLVAAIGLTFVCERHVRVYGREREHFHDRWRRFVSKENPLAGEGARYGAFVWQARRGIVASTNLPSRVHSELKALKAWPLRKPARAKTAFGTFGGQPIVWRTEGKTGIAACVTETFEPTSAWTAACDIGLHVLLVLLVCGVLAIGGVALWRAAERERRLAAAARKENARKTQFVSDVSHDLKTPLAAIGLWAHHLKAGRLDAARTVHAYDVILDETTRMTRMTENLLDYVRLEQGRRTYRREPVDLAAVAAYAADLFADSFSENGIAVSADGETVVTADRDAVTQIVVNLVGNAAKYAAAGGPVEIRVTGGTLAVADRGPGLSPEGLEKCFERFWRASDESSATTGGFGLGLAISREMARALGGDLTVAARSGGGLVFICDFPSGDGTG